MVLGVGDKVRPDRIKDASRRGHWPLAYAGLRPGKALTDVHVDKVFIGSCTNSRIEGHARGRRRGEEPRTQGCRQRQTGLGGARVGEAVKAQAEAEGLHDILRPLV